ncbi:hypothetical protein MIR68_003654 [Amoeboaphelidium protococcarum]|nr:hypothetical protein MIR68_003654 [Amoeboaphelidium protococcarum]
MSLKQILGKQLQQLRSDGLYKSERIIASPQSARVRLAQQQSNASSDVHFNVDGRRVLNMCANNYLGLSNHRHVIEKSRQALDEFGAGLSSVRFICGTQTIHKQLEQKLTQFHGTSDTILYPSCFDANAGLFEAILTSDDAVLSDELNHASIIDGIRLCKAKRYRYKNRDVQDLERQLQQATQDGSRVKLIATDGVFSMDGTVAPLPEIVQLAKKYKALVFIDECHATGFYGQNGRGTAEYFNLKTGGGEDADVHIINSTLGKALGGAMGGYTTSSLPEIVDILRQKARPYLFSNSLAPAVVGSALGALDVVTGHEGADLRQKLMSQVKHFRDSLKKAGFQLGGSDVELHPICPVMIYDAQKTVQMADKLLSDHDIYVIPFSYPVVPKGKARIRVQLSASHTKDDIEAAIDSFIQVGKEVKVI